MSDSSSLKKVRLSDYEDITNDVLAALPLSLIRQKLIIPLSKEGGRLTAAISQSEGALKPQGLQMVANCPVDLVLAPLDEIIEFIRKHYGEEIKESRPSMAGSTLPLGFMRLIEESIQNKASELLIEVHSDHVRVRQRIRGVLMTHLRADLTVTSSREIFDLVVRNGKFQKKGVIEWGLWDFSSTFRGVFFMCSAILSRTKEFSSLTIQFISQDEKLFSPTAWGMGPQQEREFEAILQKRQGLILFCGQGTDDFRSNLRSTAKQLATAERHVISVSNTGREWLPGIENFMSDGSDEHFSELLRLAFKHHPDILLVDALERTVDREYCLREALRGPLVLSHSYARDASEVLASFMAANADPSLVVNSLLGIIAQRTLRLTCPRCQEKDPIHRDRVREMGIPLSIQPPAFFRGKGCESCLNTGFDRETNIFEVIIVNDALRSLLHRHAKADDIRAYLKTSGILTLRQVAIHKAINGQTSLAEVLRVSP